MCRKDTEIFILELDEEIELNFFICSVKFKLVMIFVVSEGGLN